jgi:hypothetical protein
MHADKSGINDRGCARVGVACNVGLEAVCAQRHDRSRDANR